MLLTTMTAIMSQHKIVTDNDHPSSAAAGDDLDEALIERVIRRFYDNVQRDEVLGPIFAARITDWETHLQRMFAFWSSVTLSSGRYHGQPMPKHAALPIDARHFDRWLALFERTVRDTCSSAVAELFIEKARRIATSLEMGRALANDVLLARGQRFVDHALSVSGTPLR